MGATKTFTAVLFFTMSSAAPSQAQTEPSFCVTGSKALMTSDGAKELAEAKQKCRVGDTIMIPITDRHVIARLCDFTKAIVDGPASIICVMSDQRPLR